MVQRYTFPVETQLANVGDPTANQDVATKFYVDNHANATDVSALTKVSLSTNYPIGTSAIVVNLNGDPIPTIGTRYVLGYTDLTVYTVQSVTPVVANVSYTLTITPALVGAHVMDEILGTVLAMDVELIAISDPSNNLGVSAPTNATLRFAPLQDSKIVGIADTEITNIVGQNTMSTLFPPASAPPIVGNFVVSYSGSFQNATFDIYYGSTVSAQAITDFQAVSTVTLLAADGTNILQLNLAPATKIFNSPAGSVEISSIPMSTAQWTALSANASYLGGVAEFFPDTNIGVFTQNTGIAVFNNHAYSAVGGFIFQPAPATAITVDARSAISVLTAGSAGPATYDQHSGVLNIPVYTSGTGGVSDTIYNTGMNVIPTQGRNYASWFVGGDNSVNVLFAPDEPNSTNGVFVPSFGQGGLINNKLYIQVDSVFATTGIKSGVQFPATNGTSDANISNMILSFSIPSYTVAITTSGALTTADLNIRPTFADESIVGVSSNIVSANIFPPVRSSVPPEGTIMNIVTPPTTTLTSTGANAYNLTVAGGSYYVYVTNTTIPYAIRNIKYAFGLNIASRTAGLTITGASNPSIAQSGAMEVEVALQGIVAPSTLIFSGNGLPAPTVPTEIVVGSNITGTQTGSQVRLDANPQITNERATFVNTGLVLNSAVSVGNTSFTVNGNQTAVFPAGSFIAFSNLLGSYFYAVTSSGFTTVTTVNLDAPIQNNWGSGTTVYTVTLTGTPFTNFAVGQNLSAVISGNTLQLQAGTSLRTLDFGSVQTPNGFNLDMGNFI